MEKGVLQVPLNPPTNRSLLVKSASVNQIQETNMNKLPPLIPDRKSSHLKQLKIKREVERRTAIAQGLIADPDKPRSLSEAIRFVGTCRDMCPEFEMHQREYQNNVEKWEIVR
jgi:hypothetical protein